MKITRRKLRRLIKEAIDPNIIPKIAVLINSEDQEDQNSPVTNSQETCSSIKQQNSPISNRENYVHRIFNEAIDTNTEPKLSPRQVPENSQTSKPVVS